MNYPLLIANRNSWFLNQDEEFLKGLTNGLAKNKERYGYYLCPCRDSEGDAALDKSIICPCKYSYIDIEEFGHCFCGLFLSKPGIKPSFIPDRHLED
jgi:ferredoxin-thioredoxin reductase catalytic chain